MNLRILQSVTPIKIEQNCNSVDLSFSSEGSDCSYFNIQNWEEAPEDVPDSLRGSIPPTSANNEDKQPFEESLVPGKALFAISPVFSTPVKENSTHQANKGSTVPDSRKSKEGTMQNEDSNFSDIWKDINQNTTQNERRPPLYSYSDANGEFQNNLTLDMISEFQELSQVYASTNSVTTETVAPTVESSGYPCSSFQSNNGIIRNYPGELGQPLNQQQNNLTAMNGGHQLNMHHMSNYQSTSPNNGDGSGSTHNSPFTPSPSQRFDYPTSPHVKPSIPPNTDYPGDYNFSINFGEATESAPKSAQYTFSHSLNKLFVKMNVSCPIRFKCDTPPPLGCTIRAIPVFKRPEHVTDVVTRCPNHKIPDEANFVHRSGHLIRAEMPDEHVRYDVANDMRESVSVRLERPQIGAEYTTILYKFMCLSSCVGGINRRPLLTVFELENQEGHVLGRRVVEVRICSCPGRDRSQEEKRKLNENSVSPSNGHDKNMKRTYKNLQSTMEINQTVPGKRRRPMNGNQDDQEEFVLKIHGREKYMILKRVKEALDLMEYVTPQQKEAYLSKEDHEQSNLRQQVTSDAVTRLIPQVPRTIETSNSGPAISTVLTVLNPLPVDVSPNMEALISPSHSSHPLTATPTGVSSTPPEEGFSGPANFPSGTDANSQHYWTVDASQLGCDVPDASNQQSFERLSTLPTASWVPQVSPAKKKPCDTPCTSSVLSRESSGTSTVSVASSTEERPPVMGRYVTKVLLRQTLSINKDSKFGWNESDDKEPDDNFPWYNNNVKTEKNDSDSSSLADLM